MPRAISRASGTEKVAGRESVWLSKPHKSRAEGAPDISARVFNAEHLVAREFQTLSRPATFWLRLQRR